MPWRGGVDASALAAAPMPRRGVVDISALAAASMPRHATSVDTSALATAACAAAGLGGVAAACAAGADHYATLGVPRTADASQIKAAYKKLALKNHPDKGGDPKRFQAIAAAYSVLSDAAKRRQYDSPGAQAGPPGGGGGGGGGFQRGGENFDPFEVFSQMFGQGGGGGQMRTQDQVYRLPLTLEEIFAGGRREVEVRRSVVCVACQGRGAMKVERCSSCGGAGAKVSERRMGSSVFRTQSVCSTCGGQGEVAKEHCAGCRGLGKVARTEKLAWNVPAGVAEGQRRTFAGKADEHPGARAGDVIVVVVQRPHGEFQRAGADLLARKSIPLVDALTGSFRISLPMLDGQTLSVSGAQTNCIESSAVWVMRERGLPAGGGRRGDLFVKLSVVLPKRLNDDDKKQLEAVLGKRSSDAEPGAATGWFWSKAEPEPVGHATATPASGHEARRF